MSNASQTELKKAKKIIEAFRELDETMPIQQAAVFLTIALHDNLSQKEIAELTNMGQGSTSRNIAALLKLNRFRNPGFDLVTSKTDPNEMRKKRHNLSTKGEELVQKLTTILKK
jgi:DNA-binding MarR family transcriptional regulator